MYTAKMDVRVFGHSDATEVYAPLAARFGVKIRDLTDASNMEWHKLEVSGSDEKTVEKFAYFVDDGEDGLAEWEEIYGEEAND